MDIAGNINKLRKNIPSHVALVAVSKTKPPAMVQEAYDAGQRIFGENKVQELITKYEALPKDIQWHMIGHLQTNKVKYIAPFVALIHAVDSLKLLAEIDKRAAANGRIIDCLLQVHIAEEEHKFGFSEKEVETLFTRNIHTTLPHVRIAGLMGMATYTDKEEQVRKEFERLQRFYSRIKEAHFPSPVDFTILSMGMSSDYHLAIEAGSNMVRIGSAIFGERN